MAWLQLKTGLPYRSAFDRFSYDDLRGMYHPLHEADESKFIETLLRRLDALDENRPTRLRARREAFGLSQSELARRANVGLRAIQMYEQRNKNINRAQGARSIDYRACWDAEWRICRRGRDRILYQHRVRQGIEVTCRIMFREIDGGIEAKGLGHRRIPADFYKRMGRMR